MNAPSSRIRPRGSRVLRVLETFFANSGFYSMYKKNDLRVFEVIE